VWKEGREPKCQEGGGVPYFSKKKEKKGDQETGICSNLSRDRGLQKQRGDAREAIVRREKVTGGKVSTALQQEKNQVKKKKKRGTGGKVRNGV